MYWKGDQSHVPIVDVIFIYNPQIRLQGNACQDPKFMEAITVMKNSAQIGMSCACQTVLLLLNQIKLLREFIFGFKEQY